MTPLRLCKQCCIMPEICYKRFDRKVLIGLLIQSLTTEQEPKAIVDSTVVWVVLTVEGFGMGQHIPTGPLL